MSCRSEVVSISSRSKSLLAYAFSHFCVDFACFYILFHGLFRSTDDLTLTATGFLLYNAIAFGLQPLAGFLCDTFPRIPAGPAGVFLTAAGLLTLSFPWAALTLGAVGNAFFHIGGGIDSLRYAGGKMSRSGIFVSSGAVGVALGTLAGKSGGAVGWIPYALLAASLLTLVLFAAKNDPTVPCGLDTASGFPFAAVLLLALGAVVIRAFAGGMIPMDWRTGAFLWLLPGFAACAGKAAGGLLADRFGAKTAGTAALLLSIPFLWLGRGNAVLSVAGILLFNVTMPITLCAVASRLPDNPGLAFGLTTLGLLCGTVPGYFFLIPKSAQLPGLVALTAVSALFTFLCTKNTKKAKEEISNETDEPKISHSPV